MTSSPAPPVPAIEPASPPRLPLYVALLGLLAAFLRFGYVYGSGDQDELIPSVLHLLDGGLFQSDWLVQTVTGGVNVRTYFLGLVALPGLALPVWLATALLWAGVMVALACGVYALAWELARDRLAAALSVPVVLAVTVKWTLGDNSLAYDALVPEGVAWALAVPAVFFFLRRRWALAGALLGVAAWFHLLAGAQTALLLGLLSLWPGRREPAGFRTATLPFALAFIVTALPILVPVVLDQLGGGAAADGVSPSYVHARFRNPHHHLALHFEAGRYLRFLPLAALGLGAGVWLARAGRLRHGGFLARAAGLVAVLCGVAVVFVELVPVTLVMKLQLFKLTVLISLFASVLVCGAVAWLLPERLRRAGSWGLERRRAGLIIMLGLALIVLGLAVRGISRPGALLHPLRHLESPLGEAERWARAGTPEDALFAVPPSVSTFRSFARRAVVATYAGFVFSDRDMQAWFERLTAVAPIAPPETGFGIQPGLDAAYHANAPADWLRLQRRYGLDYVLVEKGTELPFEGAFENAGWRVYRLPEAAP